MLQMQHTKQAQGHYMPPSLLRMQQLRLAYCPDASTVRDTTYTCSKLRSGLCRHGCCCNVCRLLLLLPTASAPRNHLLQRYSFETVIPLLKLLMLLL
jgi:hypothetical protein